MRGEGEGHVVATTGGGGEHQCDPGVLLTLGEGEGQRGGSRLCHPDVNIVLSTENMLSIYTFSTAGEGGKHQFGPGGELLGGGVPLTDTASTLSYSPIAVCMTISILYREFLTFQSTIST